MGRAPGHPRSHEHREGDGRHRRAGQHRHRPAGQAAAQQRDRRRATWSASSSPTAWPAPATLGVAASRRGRGLAAAPGPAAARSSSRRPRRRRTWPTRRATPRPGIQAVDLTPAHLGPMVCPPVNLRAHLDAPEHLHDHLRRPGDDPDRARGLAGHAGAVRGDRRVGRLALGGPGHPRQHRRVHPHHRRRPSRRSAAPTRGKAIIILNPVEPPMIMRDTVFCAIGAGRRPATRSPRRSTRWSPRCSSTCPATRCAPNRSSTTRATTGAATAASRVFLEVKGNGDYLPPYAGNLDIMTAAAARVGELMARGARQESARMSRPQLTHDVRHHRHHPARRQPRDGPPVHRGPGARHGARAGRGRASRSSRSPTATASAARRSTTASRAPTR